MSIKAERQALHVDVVRRVESGHVLVLESHDLEELVGELADMQAEGWRLAGGLAVSRREYWEPAMDYGVQGGIDISVYTATLVRGVPGSPLGMEMAGGVGNE